MLGDPHFFFGRSLPFLTLSIILKNRKKICMWEVLIISHILLKRVEMVHGCRYAFYKFYFLKLILADLMTYIAKIYQIGLYMPC